MSILQQELRNLRAQINRQIRVLQDFAEEQDISIEKIQTRDGEFMLTPLLAAKAQVLAGLATLEKK